ncbi:unnamed protein product [Allacma fusca]|uniref:Gustatory receptor n=1 Tax=Allacma fusca TaxID=39272 RepID=A0A8J2LVU7_9HEXA|nr:unnamed protein product [Allacma fusca]
MPTLSELDSISEIQILRSPTNAYHPTLFKKAETFSLTALQNHLRNFLEKCIKFKECRKLFEDEPSQNICCLTNIYILKGYTLGSAIFSVPFEWNPHTQTFFVTESKFRKLTWIIATIVQMVFTLRVLQLAVQNWRLRLYSPLNLEHSMDYTFLFLQHFFTVILSVNTYRCRKELLQVLYALRESTNLACGFYNGKHKDRSAVGKVMAAIYYYQMGLVMVSFIIGFALKHDSRYMLVKAQDIPDNFVGKCLVIAQWMAVMHLRVTVISYSLVYGFPLLLYISNTITTLRAISGRGNANKSMIRKYTRIYKEIALTLQVWNFIYGPIVLPVYKFGIVGSLMISNYGFVKLRGWSKILSGLRAVYNTAYALLNFLSFAKVNSVSKETLRLWRQFSKHDLDKKTRDSLMPLKIRISSLYFVDTIMVLTMLHAVIDFTRNFQQSYEQYQESLHTWYKIRQPSEPVSENENEATEKSYVSLMLLDLMASSYFVFLAVQNRRPNYLESLIKFFESRKLFQHGQNQNICSLTNIYILKGYTLGSAIFSVPFEWNSQTQTFFATESKFRKFSWSIATIVQIFFSLRFLQLAVVNWCSRHDSAENLANSMDYIFLFAQNFFTVVLAINCYRSRKELLQVLYGLKESKILLKNHTQRARSPIGIIMVGMYYYSILLALKYDTRYLFVKAENSPDGFVGIAIMVAQWITMVHLKATTFSYSVLYGFPLLLYISNTISSLRAISVKRNAMSKVKKHIRIYKEITLTLQLWDFIYGPFVLPSYKFAVLVGIVVSNYGFVKLGGWPKYMRGLRAVYNIAYALFNFRAFARVNSVSKETLQGWRQVCLRDLDRKTSRSLMTLRIHIGSLYFVDTVMILTMVHTVIEFTVNMLVLYE